MDEIHALIEALKEIFANPWMLCFGALWVLGYMLKEFTSLNNKLIPWVLAFVGIGLGTVLIEMSVAGGIMGLIMAYLIMAFYEHIKNTIEFFISKSKG